MGKGVNLFGGGVRGSSPRTSRVDDQRAVRLTHHMDRAERKAAVYDTPKWRALRTLVRELGFGACVKCGLTGRHVALDHIIPISIAPHRAYDVTNVQFLCVEHHRQKTDSIDAPGGNPSLYRYDRQHDADMRSDKQKRWADEIKASGYAKKIIGDDHINDRNKNKNKFDGIVISC